jgi:hypothetical protein
MIDWMQKQRDRLRRCAIPVAIVTGIVSAPVFVAGAAEEEPPISPLVGQTFEPKDVDWAHPVYKTGFDDTSMLTDWRLEGGTRMSVENGKLLLENKAAGAEPATPTDAEKKHLVAWLLKVVPADFLLEFTVRPYDRQEGLNIVFFNARGPHGENIFEPPIKPRDGTFKQYHSGDFNNYHISYWASDRGTANVRKNSGFHLVARGKDYVVSAPKDAFQTVRIYKHGGTIRLTIDNVISAAWDDDGKTYGPVLTNDGWLGLRQMDHSVRCEYDNLAVYPLLKDAAAAAPKSP